MNDVLSLLKSLGDKSRLRIVAVLDQKEEICSCHLAEMLNITRASVSQHMKILLKTQICVSDKHGQWVFFRLNRETPLLKEVLALLQDNKEVARDCLKLEEISRCMEHTPTCSQSRSNTTLKKKLQISL